MKKNKKKDEAENTKRHPRTPTNPKLYARVKAEAKRGLSTPTYANGQVRDGSAQLVPMATRCANREQRVHLQSGKYRLRSQVRLQIQA